MGCCLMNKTFLTLDSRGMISALTVGTMLVVFGGNMGLFFLFVMILFLLLSAMVTDFRKELKKKMKTYEEKRGWRNVAANAAVPVLVAFAYYLNYFFSLGLSSLIVIAYVSSVAAITADKFSSEIGVLDRGPIMLLTFKRAKPGTSGAVSVAGLTAGVFASLLIGLSLLEYRGFAAVLLIVVISGILGDIVDSVFGYFEEKGIGNKYTSNFACALGGALISVALFAIIYGI